MLKNEDDFVEKVAEIQICNLKLLDLCEIAEMKNKDCEVNINR